MFLETQILQVGSTLEIHGLQALGSSRKSGTHSSAELVLDHTDELISAGCWEMVSWMEFLLGPST